MNQYITNNQPNENLTYVLDYLGLSVDVFLKMSDEKIISIYKRSADALNDGVMTKSGGKKNATYSNENDGMFTFGGKQTSTLYGNSGSKSRYFDIDCWGEKYGLLQFPKASKRERNEGCEDKENENAFQERQTAQCKICGNKGLKVGAGKQLTCGHTEIEYVKTQYKQRGNNHPTVKPVHLMAWLVRLVSKKGDIVLDPFAGSFTTGVACEMLNRNFIGIEQNEEYCQIGRARIEHIKKNKDKQVALFQNL